MRKWNWTWYNENCEIELWIEMNWIEYELWIQCSEHVLQNKWQNYETIYYTILYCTIYIYTILYYTIWNEESWWNEWWNEVGELRQYWKSRVRNKHISEASFWQTFVKTMNYETMTMNSKLRHLNWRTDTTVAHLFVKI